MKNLKIAAYVRVSTAGQNTAGQEAEITRWLGGNGIPTESVLWFKDKMSGTTLARRQFDQLQREIFSGDVNCVVCWKLDRLSRNLRDGVNVLADWTERGVRVVAVSQQLDLSGSVGRLVASVLLGIAEVENEFRRDRQAVGISAARKRGVYRGRRAGTTKAKPERARELSKQGLKPHEISRALGVSRATVFNYLAATRESH